MTTNTLNRRENVIDRGIPQTSRQAEAEPNAGVGARGRRLHNFRRGDGVRKSRELVAFFSLTAFVAPLLAVMTVSGYGFAVWALQIVAGPPAG